MVEKYILGIETTAHTREVKLLEVTGNGLRVTGVCCAVLQRSSIAKSKRFIG